MEEQIVDLKDTLVESQHTHMGESKKRMVRRQNTGRPKGVIDKNAIGMLNRFMESDDIINKDAMLNSPNTINEENTEKRSLSKKCLYIIYALLAIIVISIVAVIIVLCL